MVAADPISSAVRLLGDPEQRHGHEAPDRERHPEHAHVRVVAAGRRAHRLDRDVRREDEELHGHELPRAVLGRR
ncbi:MAG: hypothetical protein HZB46_18535 [Solirubrobacterales bacterium]|nr:hypothetical protein [Solirubrobacterales bacterium]